MFTNHFFQYGFLLFLSSNELKRNQNVWRGWFNWIIFFENLDVYKLAAKIEKKGHEQHVVPAKCHKKRDLIQAIFPGRVISRLYMRHKLVSEIM